MYVYICLYVEQTIIIPLPLPLYKNGAHLYYAMHTEVERNHKQWTNLEVCILSWNNTKIFVLFFSEIVVLRSFTRVCVGHESIPAFEHFFFEISEVKSSLLAKTPSIPSYLWDCSLHCICEAQIPKTSILINVLYGNDYLHDDES